MVLALYDLDNTLLAGDCEHAWCEFLVDAGVLDGDEVRAENERLYGEYLAGTLDIHESVSDRFEHCKTLMSGGEFSRNLEAVSAGYRPRR